MAGVLLRCLDLKRRHESKRKTRPTIETDDKQSQEHSHNPYGDVQLISSIALFTSFPPFVLAGNVSMDAIKGSQTLPPYQKADVVYGPHHTYLGFRQMKRSPQYRIEDGIFSVQAPLVSMQVNGLLIPTLAGKGPSIDADDWYIGIVQVMMNDGEVKGFYGRQLESDKADICNELFFSPQLPLVDRITKETGKQKPARDDDPAYSCHASSPVCLKDVYAGKQVYCQLGMTDWPCESFSLYSDKNRGVDADILNKVVIDCSFRTMVCAYKVPVGFGSKEVHPLQGVEWNFNATAIRRPTHTDKFNYDVTPITEPSLKILSSNFDKKDKNRLSFESSWLKKAKIGNTFACPNNSQDWKWISPSSGTEDLHTRETSV